MMRAAPTPARAVMASRVQRVASLFARHRDIVPGGVRTTPSSSSSSSIQRLLRRATSSSSSSSASSPDASTAPTSAPATHVITAYELSATPPLAVTPLSLAGDARESASRASDGGDLWRRARLAREVRRGDGDDALALALAGEPLGAPRVELFVRGAGGVVYRHGEPGAATAAMTESLGDGILASGASRPLAATGDAADPDAYWSLLREALYAHALAVFGREFEVSRRGLRAVTLTSREGTARTTTATDGGNRAAQRFELTIAPGGIGAASVVVSPGRELRSARTIREILDDPNVPDPPAGTPVAAAGGPALEGALQYEVSGDTRRGRRASRVPSSAARRSWSTTASGTRRGCRCWSARTRTRPRCGWCRAGRGRARWRTRRSCCRRRRAAGTRRVLDYHTGPHTTAFAW